MTSERFIRLIVSSFLMMWMIPGHSQECKKIGTICIQEGGARMINGASVNRDCWQYEDTYECYESSGKDTCAPLRNVLGCFELSATCSETTFSGSCARFSTTMRCDHLEPTPPGAVAIPPSFNVSADELIASQLCGKMAADANCTKTGRVCTQGPGSRMINGLSVYKDCWQYQDSYTCVNPAGTRSTCETFDANSKCKLTDSKCTYTLPGGQCGNIEKTYSCETKAPVNSTQNICKNVQCDPNGICIPAADQADQDFGKAAASMELARQIGVYTDPNNISIFNGEAAECSKGKLGIKSCCNSAGGGASNAEVLNTVVSGAASLGKEIADVGSYYVYDSLMSSDTLRQGVGAAISTVNSWGTEDAGEILNGNFDPSFSYMGFTASFGAASGAAGSIALGSAGGVYLSFNPYMLAAQIVLQWVMSCDASDGLTAMRKGQHLCHHVGTYCASKFMGACTESREAHCCYNSRLARIIQEQGRTQLGRGWGSPQTPQCGGFSQSDFEKLDLASMDLSEFIAEIKSKAINTIPGTSRAAQNVGAKVTNYFGGSNDASRVPSNASGNLHQTPTGNSTNRATSRTTQ